MEALRTAKEAAGIYTATAYGKTWTVEQNSGEWRISTGSQWCQSLPTKKACQAWILTYGKDNG